MSSQIRVLQPLIGLVVSIALFGGLVHRSAFGQESSTTVLAPLDEREINKLKSTISEQLKNADTLSEDELNVLINQLHSLTTTSQISALSGFCKEVVNNPEVGKSMSLSTQIQFISVLKQLPVYWLKIHPEQRRTLFSQVTNSVEFILSVSEQLLAAKRKLPEKRPPLIKYSAGLIPREKKQQLNLALNHALDLNRQITEIEELQEEYDYQTKETLARYLLFDDQDRSIMKRIKNCQNLSDEFIGQVESRFKELAKTVYHDEK